MRWHDASEEYKPTALEIWVGIRLKSAFRKALAGMGVYPVWTMIEPLKEAVDEDNGVALAALLKQCPKAVHAELDILQKQPLRYALSQEKFAAADALKDACPALMNETDYFDKTAFQDFAGKNAGDDEKTKRILQWFIERRADVNDCDRYERTALHAAAWRPTKDVAEYLIQHGADVNARDCDGVTPLMVAAEYGNTNTVEMLLEKGAKLDAMTVMGVNAVTQAILRLHFDTARRLLDLGAKINFAVPGVEKAVGYVKADKETAFLAAYEQQHKAWEDDRRDAETEDAVRGFEGGSAKGVQVQHALRLKTGFGKFRKG